MTPSLALHTRARRYCISQHTLWCARYQDILDQGRPAEEQDRTFPRYLVLDAIRHAVERLDADALGALEQVRSQLIDAGASAASPATRNLSEPIMLAAMQEEREAFCAYIAAARADELGAVAPLPYRRVLPDAERDALWAALRERWGIPAGGYWWPLGGDRPLGAVDFSAAAFRQAVPPASLQAVLRQRGIARVFEWRESGVACALDLRWLDPHYNLDEGYWFSAELDWVIYASHEQTITVAGWLAVAVPVSAENLNS